MLKASYKKYLLKFKHPGRTSRGILHEKETWFIFVYDDINPEIKGVGECGLFRGLSVDDRPDYEEKLNEVCESISGNKFWLEEGLTKFPSIKFGLETALLDLKNKGKRIIFPSEFTKGNTSIPINGLIWMGSFSLMKNQVKQKLEEGFRCIKIKIGAIDFEKEISLIKMIRREFSENDIEIRVDANGAFSPDEALEKLKRLSDHKLHSIEQPIRSGQFKEMAQLCKHSPLPIALDEELIGIFDINEKQKLLETIKPQYIILKPSLTGGFSGSEEWIRIAEENKISWWITSALESNIGLNALAQWTYTLNNPAFQGLGTGSLFTNNFNSPLILHGQNLFYDAEKSWDLCGLDSE